jgi:hypothetical protein
LAGLRPGGYNPAMHGSMRYGLAACAALLVLLGAYGAYWLIAARGIENGIAAWPQSMRERGVDVSWRGMRVAGFPIQFRVDLQNAALRDRSIVPAPELRIPALSATAAPWDLYDWQLGAPAGLSADLAGAGGRPPLRLAAPTAWGAVAFGTNGGRLWLRLQKASANIGAEVRVDAGDVWVTLPARPPSQHTEPNFGIAVNLHAVQLPLVAQTLGGNVEELALGLTVKGALPSGNLARSIAAWRDDGGTIELDNLTLKWDGLDATATGTMALDQDLQPIGGFSGAIEGYDRILEALVRAGRMRPGDAGLAQLALTLLATAGPDGRPQIATSFTIQNGEMFLGPARLGPAPRLAWK